MPAGNTRALVGTAAGSKISKMDVHYVDIHFFVRLRSAEKLLCEMETICFLFRLCYN